MNSMKRSMFQNSSYYINCEDDVLILTCRVVMGGKTIMDYVVNIDGKDIVIEQSSSSESRDKLYRYYYSLLKTYNGETNLTSEKEVALKRLVDSLTEETALKRFNNIGELSRTKRMMSYFLKLSELSESEKEMAEAINEVLEVTMEENEIEQERLEINGNVFLYKKDSIDIKKYLEKLYLIGNESKGNTWSVFENDGELVIY